MLFRSYRPRAPLCELVSDFWLYENYEGVHQRELILPSGTFEMVFNLQEDELRIYNPAEPNESRRYAGALVSGPYTAPFMSDAAEERAILGVHFKPGGAVAVLGIAADELRDSHINLRELWGPAADALHDRLLAVKEPTDRFTFLEHVLMQRLVADPNRHDAVSFALDVLMRTHGRAKTRDLASATGLSQRHFIDLFTGEVGLTPKLFGRLRRFLHAMDRWNDGVHWAQVAIESGYFDQAHLIHDFVAFAGYTPALYRRRRLELDGAGIHAKRLHLPLAA
jgi:AraC-like DNA-binding protein